MTLTPKFSTKKEAARFLNCSPRQIDRYREDGKLRPPLISGIKEKVRIPDEDLIRLDQELQQIRCTGSITNISQIADFVKDKNERKVEKDEKVQG